MQRTRRTRQMISKATSAKQQKLFRAFMDELGAVQGDFYPWALDTPHGILWIGNPDPKWGSIMCRFEEPARTIGKLSFACNPYSGKWNFHPVKGSADEMLEFFVWSVRQALES